MRVLKFGGSSLGSYDAMTKSAAIVKEAQSGGRTAIVVSAMRGVTDQILAAARDIATATETTVEELARSLRDRHTQVLDALPAGAASDAARAEVEAVAATLRRLLHGARLVSSCPPAGIDQILGLGERAAVAVFAAALGAAGVAPRILDALEWVVTDESFGHARILYDETFQRLDTLRESGDRCLLMAGFVGRSAAGRVTTLGRNGSDHTAAVVARALHADVCEIWTDSDGVFTADPSIYPEARHIGELSYSEAMEMVRLGRKVMHPLTFVPVMEVGIPVRVRNTWKPESPGTWIRAQAPAAARGVRGFTVNDGVTLINVHGAGLTGTPGAASYVFSLLAARGINLLFIALAGSERSLCFAVRDDDAEAALTALDTNLKEERVARFIDAIERRKKLAIVCAIGDDMRGHPGIAGRLFTILAEAGINIVAIAQGSLEANITFVVDSGLVESALRAAHDEFIP
jgi:bifunctional aspartokinase / homoserine dehydrogenase 1